MYEVEIKMKKDWTGNKRTTFVTLGSSNHSEGEREANDYYATDPHALELFLEAIKRDNFKLCKRIWECACGQGHLSKILIDKGYIVKSTDLIDRGYGEGGIDFLKQREGWHGDILTNPPYKYAEDFVEKALKLLEQGNHCVMFLKVQFLEGQSRRELFEHCPPKYVYVHSKRANCAKNGNFEKYGSSAICYCWYIWEKGFKGESIIRWI